VVWIPKYRKKKLFDWLRPQLGDVLHELARQKECRIEEEHMLEDHVHMLISIPPKLAVASVIGFIKGKSAIYIANNFSGRRKNFTGENFWARGYYVSTVGLDENSVREYIKHQEKEDQRVDQLRLM
jgi:putative transposase